MQSPPRSASAQWVCLRAESRDDEGTYRSRDGPLCVDNEETWVPFESAVAYAESSDADGVGFVFTDSPRVDRRAMRSQGATG